MGPLHPILSDEFTLRLGWSLVHFLWQGLLVGAGLAIVLRVMHRSSPQIRYIAAGIAMLVLIALPATTFCVLTTTMHKEPSELISARTGMHGLQKRLVSEGHLPADHESAYGMEQRQLVENLPNPRSQQPATSAAAQFPEVETFISWTVLAWVAGVVLFSLRLTVGWFRVSLLPYRDVALCEPMYQDMFTALVKRMQVRGDVRLLCSMRVDVPTVIGWIRPVVLLPASVMTGLGTRELEALLAHELAHVRRHDYLANLLQSLAETFLFYHPAVWWVSRQLRIEREKCCDDIAIAVVDDRITYIRALAELAERSRISGFAVAATGGDLLSRVRRLVAPPHGGEAPNPSGGGSMLTLGIAGLLIALIITASKATQPDPVPSVQAPGEALAEQNEDRKAEILSLIRALDGDRLADRQNATRRLAAHGGDAIPHLIEALAHEKAEIRHRASAILQGFAGRAEASKAATQLADALGHEDAAIRDAVMPLLQVYARDLNTTALRSMRDLAASRKPEALPAQRVLRALELIAVQHLRATEAMVQPEEGGYHVKFFTTWRGRKSDILMLRQLPQIVVLSIGTRTAAEQLPGIVEFHPEIEQLQLEGNEITDELLGPLSDLQQLRTLSLMDTRITGECFQHLAGHKNLQTVDILRSPIDDTALQWLGGINSLGELHLLGTDVTDAGLVYLGALERLRRLNLLGTRCTEAGIEPLRANGVQVHCVLDSSMTVLDENGKETETVYSGGQFQIQASFRVTDWEEAMGTSGAAKFLVTFPDGSRVVANSATVDFNQTSVDRLDLQYTMKIPEGHSRDYPRSLVQLIYGSVPIVSKSVALYATQEPEDSPQ